MQHPWGGDTELWQRPAAWGRAGASPQHPATSEPRERWVNASLVSPSSPPRGASLRGRSRPPGCRLLGGSCGRPHPKLGCAVLSVSRTGSRSPLPASAFPRCPRCRGAAGVLGGPAAGRGCSCFSCPSSPAWLTLALSAGPCDLRGNYGSQVWGSQERILEGGEAAGSSGWGLGEDGVGSVLAGFPCRFTWVLPCSTSRCRGSPLPHAVGC